MSLLSNRGRFTQDNNILDELNNIEEKSSLSLIGVNPKSLFSIDNNEQDIKEDIKDDIKKRLSKVDASKLSSSQQVSTHEEYNKKLKKLNNFFEEDDDLDDTKISNKKSGKKLRIITIVSMVLVEILTLVAIFSFGTVLRYMNLTQNVPFDPSGLTPPDIPPVAIKKMEGYKTVAVFGVDSRTGSVDKGNNADVNLVANLNMKTGEIQLISIYRDLFLSITDDNLYGKINSAYRKGGPQQAVKAINKNFDLNIKNYFAFNWKAVSDGIQLLGGIDIEITKSEFKYLNAFIHETCIATGIDSKNPAAHYIKSHGFQHLDGVQAVAYGRLRLMDSDFQRVERQKKIIGICLEKAKSIDFNKLNQIVEAILPQIAYSFDLNELLDILKLAPIARITESAGCPDVSAVRTVQMGSNGDCVVPLNLQKSVTQLHKILFDTDDYSPSNSVKNYGARITEMRHKYEEENKLKEQTGDNIDGEEIVEESGEKKTTTTKKRIATRSNASSSNNNSSTAPNNLPIVNADTIPEEPEVDNNQTQNTSTTTIANASNNLPINNNTSQNNSAPISEPPGGNGVIVYDSPGVPATTQSPSPVQNSPGSPISPESNQSNSQGTVVSGPPVGNIAPNLNSNDVVVPIIGAPN